MDIKKKFLRKELPFTLLGVGCTGKGVRSINALLVGVVVVVVVVGRGWCNLSQMKSLVTKLSLCLSVSRMVFFKMSYSNLQ